MAFDEMLARKARRLFAPNLDKEEIELDRNCESRWYKWCRLELDTYLKLMSIKLSTRLVDVRDGGIRECRLQVAESSGESPRVLGRTIFASVWRSRLVRPLCWLFLAYCIIKFNLISIIAYKRDSTIKLWKPKLRLNATRSNQCTLPNEPRFEDPELLQTINRCNEWLVYLGNPFKLSQGSPIMQFQFASTIATFFYALNLLLIHGNKPRCDYLNFVLNPHKERARIQWELDKMAGKLVLANFPEAYRLSLTDQHHTFKGPKKRAISNFISLLKSTTPSVMPANLTSGHHKILIRLCSLYTPRMIVSQLSGFGLGTLLFLLELVGRATYRLDKIQCQRWMPGGVPIRELDGLEELRERRDVEIYANHNHLNSLSNLFRLASGVEYKFLVTNPKEMMFCIEFFACFLFNCTLFSTTELLYLCSVYDKMKWLRQVEEQLSCCVELCARFKQREQFVVGRRIGGAAKEDAEEVHLVRCLTISYLNYRLFHQQQRAFMDLARIFILTTISTGIWLIILSYVISTQTESLISTWILMGISFFVVQVNFYLFTAALFLSKAQRMMKNISRLVAMGRGGSLSRKIIIDLWRRQLLPCENLKTLSGVIVFGDHISYEQLTTINFYLLLICAIQFSSEYKLLKD